MDRARLFNNGIMFNVNIRKAKNWVIMCVCIGKSRLTKEGISFALHSAVTTYGRRSSSLLYESRSRGRK